MVNRHHFSPLGAAESGNWGGGKTGERRVRDTGWAAGRGVGSSIPPRSRLAYSRRRESQDQEGISWRIGPRRFTEGGIRERLQSGVGRQGTDPKKLNLAKGTRSEVSQWGKDLVISLGLRGGLRERGGPEEACYAVRSERGERKKAYSFATVLPNTQIKREYQTLTEVRELNSEPRGLHLSQADSQAFRRKY